jgi:hypothetical protein
MTNMVFLAPNLSAMAGVINLVIELMVKNIEAAIPAVEYDTPAVTAIGMNCIIITA